MIILKAKKIKLENSQIVIDIKNISFIKKNIIDLNKKINFRILI